MELKLPTLKYRRIRGDMIEVYKLLMNKYDDNTVHLDINIDTRTHEDILRSLLLRDVTMMFGSIHFVLKLSTYGIVYLIK